MRIDPDPSWPPLLRELWLHLTLDFLMSCSDEELDAWLREQGEDPEALEQAGQRALERALRTVSDRRRSA